MRTKQAFPLASFKASDRTAGTFEALVSVFGNVDHDNDIVHPGAFTDSLKAWEDSGDPIPVIWSHEWDNPFAHIGKVTKAVETDAGLEIAGQLDMDKPFAAQVYDLMAERRVKEFSFAYDVLDADRKDGIRHLKKLNVWETGPTLKGANASTQLIGVKAMAEALEAEAKAAMRPHSTTTSDKTWDGPANEAKLPNESGPLKMAHAWQDPDGDDTAKATYKFIHHFVTDSGVGAASTKACSTGIGVLNGGRGGSNIPDDDRKGVHAHLAKHLKDAGLEAPDLKARKGKVHTKAVVTLEGSYEAQREALWPAVQEWASEMTGGHGYCVLEATYDDRVIACVETWGEGRYETHYYEVPYTLSADGDYELGEAREVSVTGAVAPKAWRQGKEGRRHSTSDEGRLQSAHDLLVELGATCAEADAPKLDEPDGAKSDEVPSPASLHLWAELQLLDTT